LNYAEDTEFVVQQISALKLYVRVIWVGPHVQMLTEQFADSLNSSSGSGKAVVTLDWHPSALTANNPKRFTSINFPGCEPDDPIPDWPCSKLTLHRLVKVAWRELVGSGRAALEVSENFDLQNSFYRADKSLQANYLLKKM
jgi:hypothetical protein